MSKLFEELKAGLEEAIAHEQSKINLPLYMHRSSKGTRQLQT
jgi:hypothetical protein